MTTAYVQRPSLSPDCELKGMAAGKGCNSPGAQNVAGIAGDSAQGGVEGAPPKALKRNKRATEAH